VAIEIELKAWADAPEDVRTRLEAIARPLGSYDKADEYWRFPAENPGEGSAGAPALGSGVRIRRLDAAAPGAVVTFKRKEVRDGIEINDEREFEVSDAASFAELLSRLGLSPWIRKRKTGAAWDADGITAELSDIETLGTFIELEILADSDDGRTVETARARLLDLLDRLGVPRERIEGRYYTELLRTGSPPDETGRR
jgi:adenylate cyclase class 2